MAKRSRMLPARRQRDDESLLIRSAESLGRVIGTLQRRLEEARKRLSVADDVRTSPAGGVAGTMKKPGVKKTKKSSASPQRNRTRRASTSGAPGGSKKAAGRAARKSSVKSPDGRKRSSAGRKSVRKTARRG